MHIRHVMHTLERAAQATCSAGIPANALLKVARRHGHACRMNVRATVRDLADAVGAGLTVLVHCTDRRSVFIVSDIRDGIVTLHDARSGEQTMLSIAQFARSWHGDSDDRRGRMMTVVPKAAQD